MFHFVPAGWQEADGHQADSALEDELHFLYVAARKTDQIREDLGSAGEVIAAQVEHKMLGKRADWPQRSAMVECLITGMIMTRYIYRLEPARSLPAAAFETALASLLQQAISGPVASAGA